MDLIRVCFPFQLSTAVAASNASAATDSRPTFHHLPAPSNQEGVHGNAPSPPSSASSSDTSSVSSRSSRSSSCCSDCANNAGNDKGRAIDPAGADYVPFVKAVNPAVYRRFIEQKYFSNVGRVHKEREERQARLEAEMALMGLSEASRAHMRKMLQAKESNYMRMQRARMDESMFLRIKRLGELVYFA